MFLKFSHINKSAVDLKAELLWLLVSDVELKLNSMSIRAKRVRFDKGSALSSSEKRGTFGRLVGLMSVSVCECVCERERNIFCGFQKSEPTR